MTIFPNRIAIKNAEENNEEKTPEILAHIPEISAPQAAALEVASEKIEIHIPEPAAEPIQPILVERVEPGRLINHDFQASEVPAVFAESLPAEKSRLVRVVLPLALTVLVVLGGLWWKILRHAGESPHPIAPIPATATGPASVPGQSDLDYTPAPPLPEKAGSPEKASTVTGIRHWSSSDSSTVVVDLQDQVQYEAHRLSDPERIYFDLHDTTLAPGLAYKAIPVQDAWLVRVRVAQPVAGITRVVLETKVASDYSVSLEQNPYRLVVEVRKLGASRSPAPAWIFLARQIPARPSKSRALQVPAHRSHLRPQKVRLRRALSRILSIIRQPVRMSRSFAWCWMPATAAGTWARLGARA